MHPVIIVKLLMIMLKLGMKILKKTSVYHSPDVMYNKSFKALIRKTYNESISTGLTSGNLNIGDNYKVSRDDLIDFICETIDESNKRYHQFKKCQIIRVMWVTSFI